MIKLLGTGLIAFLLYFLQNKLYARLWNRNLSVSVVFSQKTIFEGEQGELKEIIENRKHLPLSMLKVKFQTSRYLLFEDAKGSRTTDRFYRNDIFHIGGGERITRYLKFTGGRRGFYTIDSVDLVASDLFLTSQFVDNIGQKEEIYVYPRPFDSREFRLSLQQLNGEVLARRHLLTDPFEYRGIREYQPYDDLKSINWKATAKTGELKVNQQGYTALQSIRIFFNIQDDNIMKKTECVEASLQITAGLCAYFLEEGLQIACYGNGRDILSGAPVSVSARAGTGQLETVLRALARVDTQKPVFDFAEQFEEQLLTQAKGAVTCFVAPNHYENFLKVIEKYQEAGEEYLWFYPIMGDREPDFSESGKITGEMSLNLDQIKKHIHFLSI